MAISIDWPTGVISIPKADLTLVQSSPTVIYELNLDTFRLILKDLEDDAYGMPWSRTHNHNTEVTLGGLTYARVIEIIAPYSVTFEDDQYAVNLVGANSNVGDVVNVNQVSVRSNNSAGLISSPAIEYASFEEAVTIDVLSGFSGTGYPTGTKRQPVNNVLDALLIANFRGFNKLFVLGDLTLTTGHDITNFELEGESPNKSTITVNSGAVVNGAEFSSATIVGTLDNDAMLSFCHIGTLGFFEGTMYNCQLNSGTITLGGSSTAFLVRCYSGVPGIATPIINMNGGGRNIVARDYNGGIRLQNNSSADVGSFDFVSGQIIFDSDITAGVYTVRGVGQVTDNSTGSAVVDATYLVSPTSVSGAVWDGLAADHQIVNSFGERIDLLLAKVNALFGF